MSIRSPSTPRSFATCSMSSLQSSASAQLRQGATPCSTMTHLMSNPIHSWPASESTSANGERNRTPMRCYVSRNATAGPGQARTAAQARAGANVKHQAALARLEVKQLDGTLCDRSLDFNDTGALRVLLRFFSIVMQLEWRRTFTHRTASTQAVAQSVVAPLVRRAGRCHTSGGARCSGRLIFTRQQPPLSRWRG